MVVAHAEQSVIGGCLLDNDAYWKICGQLATEDFTNAMHKLCWTAITRAAERGDDFDAVTLAENFKLDLAYLAELTNNTPGSANIEVYARIVRDKAAVRKAAAAVDKARSRLAGGDLSAIFELQASLEKLQSTDRPSTNFHDALRAGLSAIEDAQVRRSANGGIVGAPTGIDLLDARTGGLSGGKLIILAARPSLGKTALVLQAAQAAAKAGFPVGILSLEMGAGEIALRSFAHQYQVNNTALAAGDRDVVAQLTQRLANDPNKMEAVKGLPIYVDEDNFTLGGILGRITEWHRKHSVKLVIVDHLQLIELPSNMNRNDGLGEITRQLKILAKRLDVPVVLLCQLNRNVEREQRKPRLSDLRDSGNIEQDADIVIALHGALETNHYGMREVEVGFLKFRGGLVGWSGQVMFNGPTQTFRKMEFRYDAA